MPVAPLTEMTDNEIVQMLVELRPSDDMVALLAMAIADDRFLEGALELRRRLRKLPDREPAMPRRVPASSVEIDPDRFRSYFWRRRLPLTEVGPLFGRSKAWASVMVFKKYASYWALDELATELGVHVDELIGAICSDEERLRQLAS